MAPAAPRPFQLPHVKPQGILGATELLEEADLAVRSGRPEDDDVEEKRDEAGGVEEKRKARDYTFDFSFVDAAEKKWAGRFTDRIPDIGTKQKIAFAQSRMNGNLPWANVDPDIRALNYVLAYMLYSLVEKPKWADDLVSQLDEDLVFTLWREVEAHAVIFRGRQPNPDGSQASG